MNKNKITLNLIRLLIANGSPKNMIIKAGKIKTKKNTLTNTFNINS